ncbi:nuclease-related domain-containing protein [Bacillus sp. JJ1521]|uniref:nuclease-related domain-containing protein n=1 Tax=Bacillus sp. JJ1521 TaxID=3122957 RepID=UPI002FFE63BF
MIRKVRTIPIEILILVALIRRLAQDHPKIPEIQFELAKRKKGYRGELSLNYYLDLIDKSEFLILHDIRLQDGKTFFQIDTLMITPHFYLILEVKNIAGTLYFEDESNQMIRTLNNEEEGMSNPILQAKRHSRQLTNWLQQRKLPTLPIENLVIVSDPKTIIKASRSSIFTKVMHSANLPFTFEKIQKRHTKETLTMKEMRKIAATIEKHHTPKQPDFLTKFAIQKEEIRKGVHCPECFTLPIERKRGYWFCESCCSKSKNAFIQSLQDYMLLIKPTITNEELRDFLQISSGKLAFQLLKSMNPEFEGENKSRIYHIPQFQNLHTTT